jgi:hypothetical protein
MPNTKLDIIKHCQELWKNFPIGIAAAINSLIGGE